MKVKERNLVRQGAIILIIIFGLYFILFRPFLKAGTSLIEKEIEKKTRELNRFLSEDGQLPSARHLTSLKQERKILDSKFEELRSFIDSFQARLPEETAEGGLYFIEKLHTAGKKIERQAAGNGISIPATIGFSEEMPDEEMVPQFLRELEMVEVVVTTLMEEGVDTITLIKPLKAIEEADTETGEIIYKELPLQISARCNTSTLIKFLYKMRKASPVVLVKDLEIKSEEKETLDVDLLLSGLMVE